MPENMVLTVEKRTAKGSRSCRKLRKSDRVPAVLYGHEQETVSLVVEHDRLAEAVSSGHRVLELAFEGRSEQVLLKDVQYHPTSQRILHADFYRLARGEKVSVKVEIRLKGEAAGAREGGVLEHVMHDLQVECPADQIPDFLQLDVSKLIIGESLHVRDLQLPAGVVTETDADTPIVLMHAPAVEEVAPPPEEEEAKEPEVIAKGKEEEEEAETEEQTQK